MITFDNSYLRELPGSYLRLAPDVAPDPKVLVLNADLAAELGLSVSDAAGWFSGARLPEGADPAALAYAGHQFGGFSLPRPVYQYRYLHGIVVIGIIWGELEVPL